MPYFMAMCKLRFPFQQQNLKHYDQHGNFKSNQVFFSFVRNSLISTGLPKSFIQPQQNLVLKVLWIKACPFGSENQSCNAEKPLAGCWGRLGCVELQWQVAVSWERFQDIHGIIWARQVGIELLGVFLNISLLDGGKEVILLWRMGSVPWMHHRLLLQTAFDEVQAKF